jgi:hypothetical protein
MSRYDFTNIENLIEMSERQLSDEVERYKSNNSRVSVLLVAFGALFFFIPQICSYLSSFKLCMYIFFILYVVFALVAFVCFVLFLFPKKVPQKSSIQFFSSVIMDKYQNEGYDDEQSTIAVKYTYLDHLNECSDKYREINRKKGNLYFGIYRSIIVAFFFYICIVPVAILHQNDKPLKVIVMSDDSKGKKIFNPKDVIKVHPTMTREGFSKKISDSVKKEKPSGTKKK